MARVRSSGNLEALQLSIDAGLDQPMERARVEASDAGVEVETTTSAYGGVCYCISKDGEVLPGKTSHS